MNIMTDECDPECKNLAEHFILDAGIDFRLIPDLAQKIQQTVEDYLGSNPMVGE